MMIFQEEDPLLAPWLTIHVTEKHTVQWFVKAQETGVSQDQHASQVIKLHLLVISPLYLFFHALLILSDSSKSKVVHEQKFKYFLSCKCQVGVEKSMLDLETCASGSIPTKGNVLLLDFFLFPRSIDSDANIANFVYLWKNG